MIGDDDAALVRRAGAGDREAFAALIRRHYNRIYRLCVRVLDDSGEAEDLAQDVCAGLAAKLPSYRGDSLFTTWLYRVVVNAAHDAIRRDATRRRHERDYAEADALNRAARVERESERAWLRRAMARLSAEMRTTATLVLEEGLRHAEAADILGVSEATVSWRMHELRKRLSAMTAEEEAVS